MLPVVQVWLQHPLIPHSALVWTSDCPAAGLGRASLDWGTHMTAVPSNPSIPQDWAQDLARPSPPLVLTLAS